MKRTELSLGEQLHITPQEIARRRELFGITAAEEQLLRGAGQALALREASIVAEFYADQVATPEIERLIGDAETLSRLKHHLARYLRTLFSGVYDDLYVLSRLRVGMVHNRIGVPPKLYISSVHTLLNILRRHLREAQPQGDCAHCAALNSALEKTLLFDLSLVFDTYIHALVAQVERGKEELTEYAQGLELEVTRRTMQLAELALNDPLTGLPNRRALFETLPRQLAQTQRSGAALSLLSLDLDGFKAVNDTLGHDEGDRVLIMVAQALRQTLRAGDLPVRMGGDEFVALLPGADIRVAEEVAQRLFRAFDAQLSGQQVTMSVGLVVLDHEHPQEPAMLLRQADAAMYKAKKIPGHALVQGESGAES